jgi:hypothetical protein
MKSLRRVWSMLLVMPLALAGLVGSPGVAAAAVVVPPGGAGHTCSAYHYETPQHYWQTCAWADYQYVWFTVNFGNTGSTTWYPYLTTVDYIKSGVQKSCPSGYWYNFYVYPNSVRSTDRMSCVLTRVSAAYASVGYVMDTDTSSGTTMYSPTLQVQ